MLESTVEKGLEDLVDDTEIAFVPSYPSIDSWPCLHYTHVPLREDHENRYSDRTKFEEYRSTFVHVYIYTTETNLLIYSCSRISRDTLLLGSVEIFHWKGTGVCTSVTPQRL